MHLLLRICIEMHMFDSEKVFHIIKKMCFVESFTYVKIYLPLQAHNTWDEPYLSKSRSDSMCIVMFTYIHFWKPSSLFLFILNVNVHHHKLNWPSTTLERPFMNYSLQDLSVFLILGATNQNRFNTESMLLKIWLKFFIINYVN